MSDDLDKLLPEPCFVMAGGENLTLRPFTFGQLPKAVKLLRPVIDAVGGAGIARLEGDKFILEADWPLKLPELMDKAGESLVGFVAFAVGKPREWFDSVAADEGIALTKAAFEVNGDFFVKRIAPMLGMAVPKAAPPTGEPSSPA